MSAKQAAGRSEKSCRERWKGHLSGSARLGWLRPFSRDHSRKSSRAPSPVPSRGKADNASATAGASSSTPEIRPGVNHYAQLIANANSTMPAILDDSPDDMSDNDQNIESDDEENAELGASTDRSQNQENENTDPETNTYVADSAQEDDMWKIAEAQLRRDEEKKQLLDAYYEILKSKLKNDLEPSGTRGRQKQISAFIISESNSFHGTNKLGTFGTVLKKAADCVLKVEKVISTAAQPCLPASIACAGMMLVLSVNSSLRLYTPDVDVQIALCSSQRAAGCSL